MSTSRGLPRPLGAAVGVVVDELVGEPPAGVHPVGVFGRCMTAVERATYRDRRAAGVVHAALGVGMGMGAGAAVGTATATYVAVAGRELRAVAGSVGAALAGHDLERARALLPSLVGRDVSALDCEGTARAVVESVAENTVDAVVAPAWWAATAGAPGALGYRAANTLDAMVGHRSARYARFGWASARLDDAAAYVPARLTAALVALVRPGSAGEVWRAVRDQAPAHPSPNAGVAEAAFAGALGLRLGGDNRYDGVTDRRPVLGRGRPACPADIGRAVVLSRDVTRALVVLLAGSGVAALGARRRDRRTKPGAARPGARRSGAERWAR
ncbi:MAG TPA: CobD/CbiB family cobalamin biosynthesis protein [Acidimicrobiales bacterium]|nr:CobD/CbiB family cobalamin biosynthesis protein [Acidimicrobiales bacterium]